MFARRLNGRGSSIGPKEISTVVDTRFQRSLTRLTVGDLERTVTSTTAGFSIESNRVSSMGIEDSKVIAVYSNGV